MSEHTPTAQPTRAHACHRERESCSATFRDAATEHTHTCADYPDHSAGAHLCRECGILWGFKNVRVTPDGWEHA